MWGASSIQFAWFVQSAERLLAESVFDRLVGGDPDTLQKNKVPSPANPYFGVAGGVQGDIFYQLQLQPGRVDLLIQPSEDAQVNSDELPVIDTHANISRILARVEEHSVVDQPVSRVAIVANLIHPVSDIPTANVLLSKIAGYSPPVWPDSEFVVQINSRAAPEGRLINRLVRYSVMTAQSVVLNIDTELGMPSSYPTARKKHGVLTMLDFNTVPDGTWIDEAQQRTIFRYLGNEIFRFAETCELSVLE